MQAVTDLLNNESVSDIDRLRLVMLYALRYEKENPVQLMQLFNKLASRSPKYKSGVQSNLAPDSFQLKLYLFLVPLNVFFCIYKLNICGSATTILAYLFSSLVHTSNASFSYHNFLHVTQLQLVQFLLKQAGVEKRTGDLFGNRDLLNIARNMARGLKVCI